MGLTKRKEGYYVEFPVLDDGKTLTLARGHPGAKLKRWKVGNLNRTMAKQQETLIKTELMKGLIKSDITQRRARRDGLRVSYRGRRGFVSGDSFHDFLDGDGAKDVYQ